MPATRETGGPMTCYLRNMGWLFGALDLDRDAGNQHRMDIAVRHALHVAVETPCDEVKLRLDSLSVEERFELIDDIERQISA